MKISICITTRNRREAFYRCYNEWFKYLPNEATIFVVDDASTPTYVQDWEYRFEERAGIPRVKNKCIELAMSHGADWIILSDDDVYPIAPNWHVPYINSGIKHLCFSWPDAYQDQASKQRWEKDGLHHYHLGNGCLLFIHRSCIERVGGFRTEFGMGTYEHVDFSNRIFHDGLTPHPFIDVIGSERLFYSLDKHNEVERTLSQQERSALIQRNYPIFAQKRFDTNFVPYDK